MENHFLLYRLLFSFIITVSLLLQVGVVMAYSFTEPNESDYAPMMVSIGILMF